MSEPRFADPLVRVHKLCKTYPDAEALKDLSFSLREGEILGILGPNGAGKTTAIHILLGLLGPTSGEAEVFGLSPEKHRHLIAPHLNFASAYTTLPSNLTVRENLDIFAMLYDVKKPAEVIRSLLEIFQIKHLEKRVTGALSSGEKTRLNLVKCLLNAPKLLLLDEPTSSLDPDMADQVRKTLLRIRGEQKIGVIVTSHNMMEIEEICDRILFIHEGRTVAEGTPAELLRTFSSDNLDQVFIKLVRKGDFVWRR